MIEAADLVGHADPSGKMVGFLVPLFSSRESNALLIQERSEKALVDGFRPIEGVSKVVVPKRPSSVRMGDEVIWAFAFAKGDLLQGAEGVFREQLRIRLERGDLRERPMLSVEVAEFLGLADQRLAAATVAFQTLSDVRAEAACTWRDLSIITPDLRLELAAEGAGLQDLARRLVARVDRDVLVVRVPRELASHERKTIEKIAGRVMDGLHPLFHSIPARWRIKFVTPDLPKEDSLDVALLVADEDDREVASYVAEHSPWKLDLYHLQQSERLPDAIKRFGAHAFVLSRSPEEAVVRDVVGRGNGEITTLVLDSVGAFRKDRNLETYWSGSAGQIAVPSGAFQGVRPSTSGPGRSVLCAMAAAMAVKDLAGRDAITGRWAFLRTGGLGLDPITDATASLYDRVIGAGLSMREMHLALGGRVPTPADGHETRLPPDWAREVLFPSANLLLDERVTMVMTPTRASAMALFPLRPREVSEESDLARAVDAVLWSKGWRIAGASDGDAMEFPIDTASSLRQVSARFEPPSRGDWDLRDVLGRRLAEVSKIVVTGNANASCIMRTLHERGELAVSMRDLCAGNARGGIWSLLGAQMRRLATGQLHRARTHFLALLINQAFSDGHVDFPGQGNIYDAIRDSELGKYVHFSWSRGRQHAEHTVAQVRMVSGHRNRYVDPGQPVSEPFELVVHAEGVALQPAF